MSKQVKNMLMSALKERIGENRDFLVVDASGLDGVTANRMRLALKKKNINALGVQNKMLKRVLADAGMTALEGCLAGPSTLIWGSDDVVALSKEIAQWAKDLEKLQIKGGAVDGTALTAADVDALSKSPGRLELLGQISGLLLSPGARLSAAILGAGGKLAGQIKKISEKEE